MISIIKTILGILGQIAKVFPDWYKNFKKKQRIDYQKRVRSLKIERVGLKRKLLDARGKEREKIIDTINHINDRILYYEQLLRAD